jgi:hypothetical protein
MEKDKLQINIHEERHKGDARLIRAGIMFVQQKPLVSNQKILQQLKEFANNYSGVFAQSTTLKFYETWELKREIRHRTGLPYSYDKEESKKYG